jgi:hypothetical protein
VDDSPNALAEAEAADAAGLPLPEVPHSVRAAYQQRHEHEKAEAEAAMEAETTAGRRGQQAQAHQAVSTSELSRGTSGGVRGAATLNGSQPLLQGSGSHLGDPGQQVQGPPGGGGGEEGLLDNLFTELMQAEDPMAVAVRRVRIKCIPSP